MALEYYELQMRESGNTAAAEFARVTREQFGDIALPSNNGHIEIPTVPVVRFSDEAKAALEKQKFIIHELTGQSIKSLKDSGRKFWTDWHKQYPDFEALASRRSEVAINPEKLFIDKSNNKTLSEQEEMIRKFSESLAKGRNRIPNVEAIMGGAPDYVELVFRHLDATGDYLFGEKYGYNYAMTKTFVGAGVASVGGFGPADGLLVSHWNPDYGHDYVFAAPLVVPAGSR